MNRTDADMLDEIVQILSSHYRYLGATPEDCDSIRRSYGKNFVTPDMGTALGFARAIAYRYNLPRETS